MPEQGLKSFTVSDAYR